MARLAFAMFDLRTRTEPITGIGCHSQFSIDILHFNIVQAKQEASPLKLRLKHQQQMTTGIRRCGRMITLSLSLSLFLSLSLSLSLRTKRLVQHGLTTLLNPHPQPWGLGG
jgi:hypothetical protein